MKSLLIGLFVFISTLTMGQKFQGKYFSKPEGFGKKFVWGLTYTEYWSTIKGSATMKEYFSKPSSGILVSAEYYVLPYAGIGLGVGYQQRGAGIRHNAVSAVDTSYRERLRFNTIEFPISIFLRTPKDILRGWRISGSAAFVPMLNVSSRDVLNVLEPSVFDSNLVRDVSSSFFKSDQAVQLTIGPEIDYGSGIFRIHFAYSRGNANVYAPGTGNAHNQTMGVKLSALF